MVTALLVFFIIIENICCKRSNFFTKYNTNQDIQFIILEELIQPCRVELEKITFDVDHQSENNAASPFESQVHESKRCSSNITENAEIETRACPREMVKQSNNKSTSAKLRVFQCTLCQQIFKRNNAVHYHMKKNHLNFVRCKSRMCPTYFLTEAERQQHEEKFHNNKVNKCIYCGALFSKGSDKLYMHIKKKHKDAIKCEFTYHCTNYFHSETEKDEHILKVHIGNISNDDQVKCIYCGRIISDTCHLHIHIHNKHAALKINCRFLGCATYFLSQLDSDEHFRKQHQPGESLKRWQCPKCAYKTNIKDSWIRHIKRNHTIATLKCSQCPKMFSLQMFLDVHLKTFHGERFTCQHCGKNFQKRSLKNHLLWNVCKVSTNK
jgi:hypothetical protein